MHVWITCVRLDRVRVPREHTHMHAGLSHCSLKGFYKTACHLSDVPVRVGVCVLFMEIWPQFGNK